MKLALLLTNVGAIFLAGIMAWEDMFIMTKVFGGARLVNEIPPSFVPVVVMWIINRRSLSYVFFFLYVMWCLSLAYQILNIEKMHYPKLAANEPSLFAVISVICLAIYWLIRAAVAVVDRVMKLSRD